MPNIVEFSEKLARAETEMEYLRVLKKMREDKKPDVRRKAGMKTAELHIFQKLANDDDWANRYFAAKSAVIPRFFLSQLAHDENLAVVLAIAKNDMTPFRELEKFADANDLAIQCAISLNHSAPKFIIENENDPMFLLGNLALFEHVQATLEYFTTGIHKGEDSEAQEAIQDSIMQKCNIFLRLKKHADPDVKLWASMREGLSDTSLTVTKKESDEMYSFNEKLHYAKDKAAYMNVLETFKKSNELLRDIGKIRLAESSFLERMSKSNKWHERYFVALFAFTPAYVLADLTKDSQLEVLLAVASNEHTPKATLRQLSKSKESAVRYAALSNTVLINSPISQKTAKSTFTVRESLIAFRRAVGYIEDTYARLQEGRIDSSAYTPWNIKAKLKEHIEVLSKIEAGDDPDIKHMASLNRESAQAFLAEMERVTESIKSQAIAMTRWR
ncbi:MAG: hypothetical protein LBL41_05085 [Bifidobacteriaceae bacterium]|nr:hypothetical protein [Bifidobacteriaceae bacterium]